MNFDIVIKDLKIKTMIGILPKEREKAQNIMLNLKASIDLQNIDSYHLQSVDSSNLGENLIDYAILREIILGVFKDNSFFYLESALLALQKAILGRFPQILKLKLSIKKMEIFSDCTPIVRLKWQKNTSKSISQ